jgi:hypothetical protein
LFISEQLYRSRGGPEPLRIRDASFVVDPKNVTIDSFNEFVSLCASAAVNFGSDAWANSIKSLGGLKGELSLRVSFYGNTDDLQAICFHMLCQNKEIILYWTETEEFA